MTDLSLLIEWWPALLSGALSTLRLMALSFIVAALVGLALAIARVSPRRALSRFAQCYIEVVRGMPALTLLLLIYFALPAAGISFNSVTAAVIGLGLNGAAYLAEVFRSGIEAVDNGQSEAAQMIGMQKTQVLRYVVLPQALRIVLPPMGNFAVALLKDTSVASLIAAPELMLQARDLTGEYFMPLQIYIVIGIVYFCLAFPMSRLVRWMERRFVGTTHTGA